MSKNYQDIHARTIATYRTHAAAWDEQRSRELVEKEHLDRFIAELPPSPSVLDVGCGTAEPIAAYLISCGISVTGVDASPEMLDFSRRRFPAHEWIEMDMRKLALPRKFDGILAWDSFFHLSQVEQRAVLTLFFAHLNPGGVLLATVGHEAGEVLGTVNDAPVYHSSLSVEEYTEICTSAGFGNVSLELQVPSCGMRSILFSSQYSP